MSIEIQCAGCGQKIRVGDEHAGKKARCPACGTISQVPSGVEPAAPANPLGPASTTPAASGKPFATSHGSDPNPYAGPAVSVGGMPGVTPGARPLKPHRGGLILGLAIFGLVCCMPAGIAAWIMGTIDLGEIRRGERDPEGKSLTQVGMVIGIIATVIGIAGTLFSVLASHFG